MTQKEKKLSDVDKLLAGVNMDDYVQIVVLGLKSNGDVDVQPSVPTYGFVHQIINRATWELVAHEKASFMSQEVVEEDIPENA